MSRSLKLKLKFHEEDFVLGFSFFIIFVLIALQYLGV